MFRACGSLIWQLIILRVCPAIGHVKWKIEAVIGHLFGEIHYL